MPYYILLRTRTVIRREAAFAGARALLGQPRGTHKAPKGAQGQGAGLAVIKASAPLQQVRQPSRPNNEARASTPDTGQEVKSYWYHLRSEFMKTCLFIKETGPQRITMP